LNRLSGEEDVGRIDFLAQPLEVEVEAEIERRLLSEAANFDCVLVSDQAETETPGVVTEAVRQALRMLARRRPSLVIWVDSRMRTELFRGVVVKPNEREAREACVRAGLPADAYADLRVRMQAPALVITHGERGALLLNEQGAQWVRTRPVAQPVDICGAGDSFSAGAALALAAGCSLPTAAMFANLVTSVTIMKKGTGTASPAEVLAAERELAR
jgi:bifunctional ADP-heptose synthase (sugar kinase/adenylyltransferase)